MSLNHLEALPVDTHVYQIAAQNYLPHLRGKKSVTEKMYSEIGDHFRMLYGDLAGWAHTVRIANEFRGLGVKPIDSLCLLRATAPKFLANFSQWNLPYD